MRIEPVIQSLEGEHCIALWRNVLIQIWHLGTSEHGARLARQAGKRLLSDVTGPVSGIVVVEEQATLPAPEARIHLSGLVTDFGLRAKMLVLVQEGGGFRGAAVRAVMTGLMVVSKIAVPYQICRTVDEAEARLVPMMEPLAGERGELAHVVADLRARIPQA
jgi:hypothetical protein